jgi:AraC-like DNA-binding protein
MVVSIPFKLPQNDEIFSYYLPRGELSPYIAYYSITKPCFALSSISPLFIPDLGGSLIISRYENDWGLVVWGPFNKLTGIEDSPRKVLAQYFIEFQPGGLSRLIYPNSKELLNQKIPTAEVDYEIHNALKTIFEQDKCEPDELVSFLDEYFWGLLENKRDIFENGRHILGVLQGFEHGRTMTDLSKETHYSARHINRYLNVLAGVSGKNYLRVKRFNNATRILKESKYSIEQAALQLNYYDPAHFVHDFTELAGLSPTLYRKNMSSFYNESSKRL